MLAARPSSTLSALITAVLPATSVKVGMRLRATVTTTSLLAARAAASAAATLAAAPTAGSWACAATPAPSAVIKVAEKTEFFQKFIRLSPSVDCCAGVFGRLSRATAFTRRAPHASG